MTSFLRPRLLSNAVLLVGLGVVAAACPPADKGDTSGNGNPDVGCSPIASAGGDAVGAVGGLMTLDASNSAVCDAASIVYIWNVEAVPVDSEVNAGDLDLADPAKPTFTADRVGTYVFSLVVSDASGVASAPDLVVVTISAGSTAPTADCGGNLTAEVGDRVDLDASGSSDPEGAQLNYQWTLASVPDCSGLGTNSVFNADQELASFVPDCASTFVVGLAVSDGESWSSPAYCSVTVGTGNQRPVADAGASSALSPCTDHVYSLDGFGSYDPDGNPITYLWTLLAVPTGSTATQADLSDPTSPNPDFSWDLNGSYTFELRVNDGTLESAPDVVTYNFQSLDQNAIPIANAGSDQTINKDTECETASYIFTCEECPSDDVSLDGTASDDPTDGDDISFLWSDESRELTIENPSSPRTKIYTPSFPSTYAVVTTKTWDVVLSVSDCADTDTDTVRITYNCTGTY